MRMVEKTLEAEWTPATLDTRPSPPPRLPGRSPVRRDVYAKGDRGVELLKGSSDTEVALG